MGLQSSRLEPKQCAGHQVAKMSGHESGPARGAHPTQGRADRKPFGQVRLSCNAG